MALQKYSGLPKNKIVGMAGILDSSRFIYFLSQELNSSVNKIKSFVLGGHGDTMVAMLNSTLVDGKKIDQLLKDGKLKKETLEKIVQRTKSGGAEIVKLLEKGSAFYAPAASGVEMAESYLKDLKKQLPCAAYLNGEYGVIKNSDLIIRILPVFNNFLAPSRTSSSAPSTSIFRKSMYSLLL